LSEVEKASDDPIKSDKEKTVIEAVYEEEAKFDHLTQAKAKNKVQYIVHKYATVIANRISKKSAKKITKNIVLKRADNENNKKNIIKKTVEKVVNKEIKKQEKKTYKKGKGIMSTESLMVKSTRSLLKEENLNNIVDVISNLYK